MRDPEFISKLQEHLTGIQDDIRELQKAEQATITLLEVYGKPAVEAPARQVTSTPAKKHTEVKKKEAVPVKKHQGRGRVGKTAEEKKIIVNGILEMMSQDKTLAEALKKYNISDASFYVWKKELNITAPVKKK